MSRAALVALALAAAPLALAPAAFAQTGPAAAFKSSRNVFGQPDLSGYWSNATLTRMVRPATYGERLVLTPDEVKRLEDNAETLAEEGNRPTDPNAPAEFRNPRAAAGSEVGGYNRGWLDPGRSVMRVRGEPRTSLITTANGQPPPRKTGAPAAPQPGGAGGRPGALDNPEARPLEERCIIGFGRNGGPPMFPNYNYNNNYQVLQTADAVLFELEMVHDTRIVRLNSKHRTDEVRPWFGDSIGWYEGDSLVVETTHIPQQQAYMGSWRNLKVTERLTRVGKDRLYYAFTVEDPTIWATPWGGEYEFHGLGARIFEYACHEGNYGLAGILAGARFEEAEAAKKAAVPAPPKPGGAP
jgi:hypothetical protein